MALMDTFTEVHSLYETQEKLLVGRYAWHTPDLVSNIDFNSKRHIWLLTQLVFTYH